MTRSRSRAALQLSLVVEPGDPRLVAWRERCDPVELWQAVARGGADIPDRWHAGAADAPRAADAALRRAEECGARWIVPGGLGWPVALDDLDHLEGIGQVTGAPLGLWVRGGGDLTTIAAAPVAVVGARGCTTYGAEAASDIAADCADQGHAIVSGAAFGIDACAHRGALLGGGPTVAVMACGVDVDYPRAHAALLHRIAEEGLVVSEFAPGSEPQRHRFLVRNRIIAALSVGVVVVEAATRSGSLNTLHWADQLGRTTMAVPGPITSQASCGAHRAVRDGKALLVTSGRDVVADTFGVVAADLPEVGPGARRVWVRLGGEPVSGEQIAASLRLSPVAVHRALRELERHGVVARNERGWSRDIVHPGDDGRVG
jgi:DNA processing protein